MQDEVKEKSQRRLHEAKGTHSSSDHQVTSAITYPFSLAGYNDAVSKGTVTQQNISCLRKIFFRLNSSYWNTLEIFNKFYLRNI